LTNKNISNKVANKNLRESTRMRLMPRRVDLIIEVKKVSYNRGPKSVYHFETLLSRMSHGASLFWWWHLFLILTA